MSEQKGILDLKNWTMVVKHFYRYATNHYRFLLFVFDDIEQPLPYIPASLLVETYPDLFYTERLMTWEPTEDCLMRALKFIEEKEYD